MPPANQDAQIIARELSNTLRKMANDQQSFLTSLNNALNPNQPGGTRRSTGSSPTAGMEANRRLTGSVKNLNKFVSQAASGMHVFARNLNVANRAMRKSMGPNNISTPLNNMDATLNSMAANIASMVQHLQNNTSNGGGGNRNNNPSNNNRSQPPMFERMMDAFTNKLSSFSLIAAGRMAISDAKYAASTGSHYGFDTYGDALTMGMSAKDYMQLGADYRSEALKAIGGMDEWRNSIKNMQLDLFPFTGSLADAAKITAELQKQLTNSGIAFEDTLQVIGSGKNGLVGSLKNLSIITGQTVSSLTTTLGSITQTDTARTAMMQMTGDQRAAYVQDQAKMLQYYTMLTGSLARAQEIMTKQAEIQSKPAKDRMVTAAKRAAIMTAMGMDFKEAQEYRRLASMSNASLSRNPELMKRKQQLEDQGSRLLNRGLGSDDLYIQNLYDNYASKGQFDDIKSSNTTLDTSLKLDSVVKQMDTSFSKFLSDSSTFSKATNTFLQAVEKFEAAMTMAITVGGLALLKHLTGSISIGGKTLNQRLRARTNSSSSTNSPSLGGWSGSKKLLVGGVLGGVATMAAGYALDHYKPSSEKTEGLKNTASSALMYAGLGATIGSIIAPGIGTAIGAGLGGIAGAVVSAKMDKATPQSIYDANKSILGNDITIEALKSKHKQEMDSINAQISNASKLRDVNKNIDAEKVASAEKELKALYEKKALLEKNQPEDVRALSDMKEKTSAYLKTLQDSKLMADAIDESFGRRLGIGSERFDSSNYSTKMGYDTTSKLGLDFASTMAGKIPSQVLQSLAMSLSSGESITGDANLKAIHEFIDIKSAQLDESTRQAGDLVRQSQQIVDARDTENATRLFNSMPQVLAKPISQLKENLVISPLDEHIPTVQDMRFKELPTNMATMGMGYSTIASKNLETALTSKAIMGDSATRTSTVDGVSNDPTLVDNPLAYKLDLLIELMSRSNELTSAATKDAADRDTKFRQNLDSLINQIAFNNQGTKKTTTQMNWSSSTPWSMVPSRK